MLRAVVVILSMNYLAPSRASSPDAGLNMIQIVESRGYPLEQHTTTTLDGFVLGLFRIPSSPFSAPNSSQKGPILLMHALLDSSYSYVCQSRNQSLAYILADEGYDVWFGNVRGNTWSRSHVRLHPTEKAFWDFSLDEHAKFDIPATVDYILAQTGAAKMPYVGHSQGTTIGFAAFSSMPELAAKIEFFVGFGPVWTVSHTTSLVMRALIGTNTDKLIAGLGTKEFLPSNPFIQALGKTACMVLPHTCDVFLELVCGPAMNIDESRLDAYISQTPAGTSAKNMLHWGQGVRKDGFRHYDYGCGLFTCKNKEVYGTREPPSYNVSAFTIPTALFYGENDALADVTDVQFLLDNLPNLAFSKKLEKFSHLDFTWGMNAHEIVYPDVLQLLNQLKHDTKVPVVLEQ